ncbi:hypothetical protein D3C72_431630 [compost metagenome]
MSIHRSLHLPLAAGLSLLIALPALAEDQQPPLPCEISARPVIAVDPALVERRVLGLAVALDGPLGAALEGEWAGVLRDRRERVFAEAARCADSACRVDAFKWTPTEAEAGRAVLVNLLSQDDQLEAFVADMRGSGEYALYDGLDDAALLGRAWADLISTYSRILDVYGKGVAPLYPAIDSNSFDPSSRLWGEVIKETTDLIAFSAGDRDMALAHDPAHRLALLLLNLNARENAGFFADLNAGENRAARAAAATTRWEQYPYSLILVLGDGPEGAGQRLGTFGRLRLERAADLYRQGKAPFIVVSGGNVHPAGTTINEAQEMKRELACRYNIPERAIIIEPHARHTTTNFRNTARLMVRYGIPTDRPALATTSVNHSRYAAGVDFDQNASAQIGLIPRAVVGRLNAYDIEFLPNPKSTHLDTRDPLDP